MYVIEDNLIHGTDVSLSGLKIAIVRKVEDKKSETNRGRVFCVIYGVHNVENTEKDYGVWIEHLRPIKDRSGDIPAKDDKLWVMCVDNNPMCWVWLGWVAFSA